MRYPLVYYAGVFRVLWDFCEIGCVSAFLSFGWITCVLFVVWVKTNGENVGRICRWYERYSFCKTFRIKCAIHGTMYQVSSSVFHSAIVLRVFRRWWVCETTGIWKFNYMLKPFNYNNILCNFHPEPFLIYHKQISTSDFIHSSTVVRICTLHTQTSSYQIDILNASQSSKCCKIVFALLIFAFALSCC